MKQWNRLVVVANGTQNLKVSAQTANLNTALTLLHQMTIVDYGRETNDGR